MNRNIVVVIELDGWNMPVELSAREHEKILKAANVRGCDVPEFVRMAVDDLVAQHKIIDFPRPQGA